MSNYLLVRKKFVSLGISTIELADININTLSVTIEDKKEDRTFFLQYGSVYDNHSRMYCTYNGKNISTSINIENNEYYFNLNDSNINLNDKIILSNTGDNTKNKIYCIVNKIINNNIYIDYYTESNNIIKTYSNIELIKYENIKEVDINNEFFINYDELNNEMSIPIFLPIMTLNKSSKKSIIIHIDNRIRRCDVIFLPKKNNLINNLNKNSFYVLSHSALINKDFSTYIISFIYNGYNTWFST